MRYLKHLLSLGLLVAIGSSAAVGYSSFLFIDSKALVISTNEGSGNSVDSRKPYTISVSTPSVAKLYFGTTVKQTNFTATVLGSDGTSDNVDQSVEWQTSINGDSTDSSSYVSSETSGSSITYTLNESAPVKQNTVNVRVWSTLDPSVETTTNFDTYDSGDLSLDTDTLSDTESITATYNFSQDSSIREGSGTDEYGDVIYTSGTSDVAFTSTGSDGDTVTSNVTIQYEYIRWIEDSTTGKYYAHTQYGWQKAEAKSKIYNTTAFPAPIKSITFHYAPNQPSYTSQFGVWMAPGYDDIPTDETDNTNRIMNAETGSTSSSDGNGDFSPSTSDASSITINAPSDYDSYYFRFARTKLGGDIAFSDISVTLKTTS